VATLAAALLLAVAWPNTDAAAQASATPRAATWVTDGTVSTIVATPTTIYIAGRFTQVGPSTSSPGSPDWQPRNKIAAIDAATGQVTAWNPNCDASVMVLSLALSGTTLYVGGLYSNIGGKSRNGIAAVDTTTGLATDWNPGITDGASTGRAYDIKVSGNTVYVGGQFDSIGGQPRSCIAALSATTGLATDWNPNAVKSSYPAVNALVLSGSTVYVGGAFTGIGGKARTNIAALDAATGTATDWAPETDTGSYSDVNALALSGSLVYAGGDFSGIGGKARNGLAAIDAATGAATDWNPDADNGEGLVTTLAVLGTTVFAGGGFTTMGVETRNFLAAVDTVTGLPTAWNPNAGSYIEALAVNGTSVYVGGQFTTIGGNSRPYFAEFPLADTTPPTGSIVINGNRSVTNSVNATLSLAYSDGNGSGVAQMRFSDDGAHWTAWEKPAATRAYSLPVGDGYKTVRVQFLDKANNRSAVYSDYIRLDTVPPTGGIVINGGASTTASLLVTLGLTYADGTGSGVSRMRFSDDGAHWTLWETPKGSRSHTLPAGLGNHTVRVQYLDAGNNYSPVYSDYIKVVAP